MLRLPGQIYSTKFCWPT